MARLALGPQAAGVVISDRIAVDAAQHVESCLLTIAALLVGAVVDRLSLAGDAASSDRNGLSVAEAIALTEAVADNLAGMAHDAGRRWVDPSRANPLDDRHFRHRTHFPAMNLARLADARAAEIAPAIDADGLPEAGAGDGY